MQVPPKPPNRIRQLRLERDINTKTLAQRYDVYPATVGRWERGESQIPDEVKIDLAALLEVSVGYMMGWEESPVPA